MNHTTITQHLNLPGKREGQLIAASTIIADLLDIPKSQAYDELLSLSYDIHCEMYGKESVRQYQKRLMGDLEAQVADMNAGCIEESEP